MKAEEVEELSRQFEIATSKTDLLEIKRRCLQAHINVGSTTYASKTAKENILRLVEKVDRKIANLEGGRTFAFVGVPQSPSDHQKLHISVPSQERMWEDGAQIIDSSLNEYTVQGTANHLVGARNCKIVTKITALATVNDKANHNLGKENPVDNAAQIYIKDIDGCHLDLVCDGPVYIENAKSCNIIVKCHQLRLKQAVDCKVYAWTPANRFVVERCRLVEVGRFWGQELPSVDDFSDPSERSSVRLVDHEP